MREALFEVEVVVVEKSATHALSVSSRLPHTPSTPKPHKAMQAHRILSLALGMGNRAASFARSSEIFDTIDKGEQKKIYPAPGTITLSRLRPCTHHRNTLLFPASSLHCASPPSRWNDRRAHLFRLPSHDEEFTFSQLVYFSRRSQHLARACPKTKNSFFEDLWLENSDQQGVRRARRRPFGDRRSQDVGRRHTSKERFQGRARTEQRAQIRARTDAKQRRRSKPRECP